MCMTCGDCRLFKSGMHDGIPDVCGICNVLSLYVWKRKQKMLLEDGLVFCHVFRRFPCVGVCVCVCACCRSQLRRMWLVPSAVCRADRIAVLDVPYKYMQVLAEGAAVGGLAR
jgi:hypothetical protein